MYMSDESLSASSVPYNCQCCIFILLKITALYITDNFILIIVRDI